MYIEESEITGEYIDGAWPNVYDYTPSRTIMAREP